MSYALWHETESEKKNTKDLNSDRERIGGTHALLNNILFILRLVDWFRHLACRQAQLLHLAYHLVALPVTLLMTLTLPMTLLMRLLVTLLATVLNLRNLGWNHTPYPCTPATSGQTCSGPQAPTRGTLRGPVPGPSLSLLSEPPRPWPLKPGRCWSVLTGIVIVTLPFPATTRLRWWFRIYISILVSLSGVELQHSMLILSDCRRNMSKTTMLATYRFRFRCVRADVGYIRTTDITN